MLANQEITILYPRPALMARQCEGWLPNPAFDREFEGDEPMLVQCKEEASYRIVMRDERDKYTKKLCPRCAELQRLATGRDGIVIISDNEVNK